MRVVGSVTMAAALVAVGAWAPSGAEAARDPVFCYAIKASRGFDAFGKTDATKRVFARVNDVMTPANPQGLLPGDVPGVDFTYQVRKVRDVCMPAQVDGRAIHDPDTSWLSYQFKQERGSCDGDPAVPCRKDDDCVAAGAGTLCTAFKDLIPAKFDKKDPTNLSVRVVDAYSDVRLDFSKEALLYSPATVGSASHLGVPAGAESYKCYSIKPTKKVCAADSPLSGSAYQPCKREDDCGGVHRVTSFCETLPKFPKQTHPDGLSVSLTNAFHSIIGPDEPPKAFELRKLRHFCQATGTKIVGELESPAIDPQAGLLCYQVKLAGAKCAANAPRNALKACKNEEQCGGERRVTTYCEKKVDPKFDKKDPNVLAQYMEDGFFQHRLDVAKEFVMCSPACREPSEFELNDLVSHITHLALGPNGAHSALAGLPRGVNVDGDIDTYSPFDQDPTGGIDNALQGIGGLLNGLLQEQLDDGGFTLLFQASELANGPVRISGFTGDLASPAGCPLGTPPAALDPGNPATPCNYVANRSSFTWDFSGDCLPRALISLDVDVNGAESTPTATAIGGGPGTSFSLNIPFGDQDFSITAENVLVEAEITHDGSGIDMIRGVLGGGVNQQVLVDTVATLPNSCAGGVNEGNPCETNADCPSSICELLGGFTAANLSEFIYFSFPPDLDLDPNVDGNHPFVPAENESVSIGLLFRATKATALGID